MNIDVNYIYMYFLNLNHGIWWGDLESVFIERVEDEGNSSGIIYLMSWGAYLPRTLRKIVWKGRNRSVNFRITEYEENYCFTN